MSDAALERRISEEFGIRGGFCSCGHFVECFGGSSPKVVIQTPEHPPLLLQGQQLLRAVRQVLHISRPDELF